MYSVALRAILTQSSRAEVRRRDWKIDISSKPVSHCSYLGVLHTKHGFRTDLLKRENTSLTKPSNLSLCRQRDGLLGFVRLRILFFPQNKVLMMVWSVLAGVTRQLDRPGQSELTPAILM